jgi:hypothetical protein
MERAAWMTRVLLIYCDVKKIRTFRVVVTFNNSHFPHPILRISD